MTLQFVIGRAGTGKTHHCRESIVRALKENAGPQATPLIWLLPEQAAAQAEASLLEHPDIRGWTRLRVLSFRRLARLVIEEKGGSPRPFLDEQGRLMLLRALCTKCRDRLQVFGPSAGAPGFIERLAQTFTEFAQYSHSFDDIERCITALQERTDDQLLLRKLHDLHLLGRAYEEHAGERFANPDHYLNHLAARLSESSIIHGADVWIDGFASFTPQEMHVLAGILSQAARIQVALLLDPDRLASLSDQTALDPARLFSQTEETYLRLRGLASDSQVEILKPILLASEAPETRLGGSSSLHLLEDQLAVHDFMPPAPEAVADVEPRRRGLPSTMPDLLFLEAQTRREEVEAIARMIRRMVRDNTWRFRDMAVIGRNLTPYEDLIRDAFDRHDIPFFLDKRRTIAHHPLVELIRSALRAVLLDYRHEDVIHCLKTDLLPVSRKEADVLENAGLAGAWRGRGAWRENALDDDRLRNARNRAFAPLKPLEEMLATMSTTLPPTDFVEALLKFLKAAKAADTLAAWSNEAEEAGRVDEADEHRQVWDHVTSLLMEMSESLRDEALPAQDLADTLETGLETLTLALAPPTPDQVLVSSVERSRQPELRATFLIGLNEQIFPNIAAEDVIFTDNERERLETETGGRFEMGPTSTTRMLRERYLAYVAVTRASQHLCLSWSTTSETGGVLRPSSYLEVLRAAVQTSDGPPPMERRVDEAVLADEPALTETRNQMLRQVVLATRTDSTDVSENSEFWRETARHARQNWTPPARRPTTQQLLPEVAAAMFARHPDLSVSRLETAARCPFQYYANYALNLKERNVFEVGALEIGSFHHHVLERLFDLLRQSFGNPPPEPAKPLSSGNALDWADVPMAEAALLLEQALEESCADFLNAEAMGVSRAAFLVQRTRRQLLQALESLIEAGRSDAFVQVAAELEFGDGQHGPPAYTLLADDPPCRLRGIIDRVDVARDGAHLWLRVFDYKSSARRLYASEVIEGLALQLPLYLRALREVIGSSCRTAGAFFYGLQPSLTKEAAPPSPSNTTGVRLQARGIWAEAALDVLTPGSGEPNPHLAIKLTKKGALYKQSSTDGWLPDDLLEELICAADVRARELATGIRSGDVSVLPYRQRNNTGCQWCAFGDVCRFDPGNDAYREIPSPKREEILEILSN